MNTFSLQLYGETEVQSREGLQLVVAHDASGSFAVGAGHERMLAILTPGVLRLRYAAGKVEYAATMGGTLYFVGNRMHIVTQEFAFAPSPEELDRDLKVTWQAEDAERAELRAQIHRLDRAMLAALARLERARV